MSYYDKPNGWTEDLREGDQVLHYSSSGLTLTTVKRLTKTIIEVEQFRDRYQRGPSRSQWTPYANEGQLKGARGYHYRSSLLPVTPKNLVLKAEHDQEMKDRRRRNELETKVRGISTHPLSDDQLRRILAITEEPLEYS